MTVTCHTVIVVQTVNFAKYSKLSRKVYYQLPQNRLTGKGITQLCRLCTSTRHLHIPFGFCNIFFGPCSYFLKALAPALSLYKPLGVRLLHFFCTNASGFGSCIFLYKPHFFVQTPLIAKHTSFTTTENFWQSFQAFEHSPGLSPNFCSSQSQYKFNLRHLYGGHGIYVIASSCKRLSMHY